MEGLNSPFKSSEPLPWKPVGEAWSPAMEKEPILEVLFWVDGEVMPLAGDLPLPESDDPIP